MAPSTRSIPSLSRLMAASMEALHTISTKRDGSAGKSAAAASTSGMGGSWA